MIDTELLFFDLDGTLTDPFVGITRSLQHALAALGRPHEEAEALRGCIGPPLRQTFAALLGSADPGLVEQAIAIYRERYFDVGLYENVPYDGVAETLEALRARGHRMRVVTSKVTPAARRIVEHFGLATYFDEVHGSEPEGRFDDKRELLAHVLVECRSPRRRCVMIGDRMHDVAAARANGVRAIGATWGFGTERELRDAGADELCDAPAAIADALGRLRSAMRPEAQGTTPKSAAP